MDKNKITRYIYNTFIIICLAAGALIVVLNYTRFGSVEYTDNARIRQHITPQNTRVQGFIKEIRFEEYQPVHKGDTLLIIEDTEFRLRLAQAEAELAKLEQSAKATGSSIATSSANILTTEAAIEEAKVNLENSKREDARFEALLAQGAVTKQQYDNVHTAFKSAEARYNQMLRNREAQSSVKNERGHMLAASEAALNLARAAVELAELNLSYCYITATCDGILGAKTVNVGQLVAPGQTMVEIVDSSEIWAEANYKESQLCHITPGCKVKIKADAVPDKEYVGTVERISDATGSAFSLLPIDNATGNFVKVEQRVTVRISLDENAPEDLALLHAGYNLECEIDY
ncbi:MAG: HlyD family secretion protein [Muribaculaceae bacterium]